MEELIVLIFDIWFGKESEMSLIKAVFKGLTNKFETKGHYECSELV